MDSARRDGSLASSLPASRTPFGVGARRTGLLSPAVLALSAALAMSLAPAGSASAQTVSLNQGGEKVSISVGDTAKLPPDFPADIRLPDAYALTRVQQRGRSTTLQFDVPGDLDVAAMELESRLLADGWHAARVGAPPTGRAQAWEKDARALIAWFAPGSHGGVRVQLQLLPQH